MKERYSIMTSDWECCYRCGAMASEAHHVLHGPNRKLSEEYGLMVPLCSACHYEVHHRNGEVDLELKQRAQRDFLIKTFGRSYI